MSPEERQLLESLVRVLIEQCGLSAGRVRQALSNLGSEELYYWHAKCSGPEAPRGAQALTCLTGLSGPGRQRQDQ